MGGGYFTLDNDNRDSPRPISMYISPYSITIVLLLKGGNLPSTRTMRDLFQKENIWKFIRGIISTKISSEYLLPPQPETLR